MYFTDNVLSGVVQRINCPLSYDYVGTKLVLKVLGSGRDFLLVYLGAILTSFFESVESVEVLMQVNKNIKEYISYNKF